MLRRNFPFYLFTLFIFLTAVLYRIPNLSTPFWVDEFSTARNSILALDHGLGVFSQSGEFFEHHNVTTHFLIALSFKLFGITESAARLPIVFIGSLVPVLVFVVARKLYDSKVALFSTLLTLFSYFEITWSRQARSYSIQQAIILISLWIYIGLVRKFSPARFALLVIFLTLGVLTHTTFLLFINALFLHFVYLCFHWKFFNLEKLKQFLPFSLLLIPFLFVLLLNNYLQGIIGGVLLAVSNPTNNLWYYHSFLWREQTVVALLSAIALFVSVFNYKKGTFLVVVPILTYLFFICFLFPPYVSRYLLPVWPFFLILAGLGISSIANAVNAKYHLLIGLALTLFIIGNGDTFVIKPKRFYSVNHDMREVALIDYNQVYNRIKEKTGDQKETTAVIDTWPDRARWYIGYDNPNIYYFHWENETGTLNGLSKETEVKTFGNEKFLPNFTNPPIRFIGNVNDLQIAMSKYPRGFIWIDDTSLSEDIQMFVQKNFKKELFLDHYTLDDNPYSIWPGTLYSWGIE